MSTKLEDSLTILRLALLRCHADEIAALEYVEHHVTRKFETEKVDGKREIPKSNRIAAVLKLHGPLTIPDICSLDTYMPHISQLVAKSILEIHGHLFQKMAGGRWGLKGVHEQDDTVTAERLEQLRGAAYDLIADSETGTVNLAELCSRLEVSKTIGERVLDFSWFKRDGRKYSIAKAGEEV